MKRMPKTLFDSYIDISRCYWEAGGEKTLAEKLAMANEIARNTPVDFLAVSDLVDSIIRRSGFYPDATNEMLYDVLAVMGWEVADIVKEHPAE